MESVTSLLIGRIIGYRTEGIGGYTVPYTELPMITDKKEAFDLYHKLQKDFPTAEWMIVEVWD